MDTCRQYAWRWWRDDGTQQTPQQVMWVIIWVDIQYKAHTSYIRFSFFFSVFWYLFNDKLGTSSKDLWSCGYVWNTRNIFKGRQITYVALYNCVILMIIIIINNSIFPLVSLNLATFSFLLCLKCRVLSWGVLCTLWIFLSR